MKQREILLTKICIVALFAALAIAAVFVIFRLFNWRWDEVLIPAAFLCMLVAIASALVKDLPFFLGKDRWPNPAPLRGKDVPPNAGGGPGRGAC